mmetsp:Transcript_13111/g.10484  ORF Transcript_13111/g.10484 Transcript_13111/m.10484 type:complete len:100 (-) Transcript_13111:238-537(-)
MATDRSLRNGMTVTMSEALMIIDKKSSSVSMLGRPASAGLEQPSVGPSCADTCAAADIAAGCQANVANSRRLDPAKEPDQNNKTGPWPLSQNGYGPLAT